ncbi:alcohol dehydrogenase superfamily protein [Cyathus striatus]|nr:alcohol dehydrogenase superfamily protein [Cyathus striatus]
MSYPSVTREYQYTQLGSYNNLVIKVEKVEKPRATDVVVKVHAVSLNYRDLMIANKTYPAVISEKGFVPCSDMAGEIVAVGEDVKGWKVGDRVLANFSTDHIFGDTNPEIQNTSLGGQAKGVLTEYRTFPAHSLVHIPGHLSYEEASTLPCAAVTAYNALLGGSRPLKAGDYVLVQGTGGVSVFALQFAVASGAVVIATSSSDNKLKLAAKLGAKHLINYRKTPNWDEEVNKITNGKGVDHIVEVGGSGTLPRSINAIRVGGSVSIVGAVSRDKGSDENFVFSIIRKAVVIRGIHIGSVDQFRSMNRMIAANPDITRPVVDEVFPFEQALQAYAHLESQKHVGNVVIKVSA